MSSPLKVPVLIVKGTALSLKEATPEQVLKISSHVEHVEIFALCLAPRNTTEANSSERNSIKVGKKQNIKLVKNIKKH